jgi:succinoglycan biosynthesis transport protein ExoP
LQPDSPTLAQKLEPFTRRRRIIAIVVVAITALTYWHFSHQPRQYTATTQIYAPSAGPSPVVGSDPETDPTRRLLNEAAVLQSPAVAAKVAQQLGYRGDPRDLLTMISVSPSSVSDFLGLSATTPNARRSANLANGFATAFVALSSPGSRRSKSAVRAISTATVPTQATGASPVRDAIFAAVLGLVLAGMLVLGLEAFDRRIRHPLVEAEYGLPLLASIPFSRRAHAATLSRARMPSDVMERVRGLRTILDHVAGPGSPPRSLLLTSAIPQEGKSTLVKGLALACFESAKSVLVIDADLRRPSLHEFFEAPLVPGLSDVLRSAIPLAEAVQEVAPGRMAPTIVSALGAPPPAVAAARRAPGAAAQGGLEVAPANGGHDTAMARAKGAHGDPVLHLLSSGSGTADPAALLSNARLKPLLAEATARYDLVLIDSPPVLAVSDAVPLAAAVDAVVVVARSGFTTRDAAARCRQALERVPDVTVLGVVANAVTDDSSHAYYADKVY